MMHRDGYYARADYHEDKYLEKHWSKNNNNKETNEEDSDNE